MKRLKKEISWGLPPSSMGGQGADMIENASGVETGLIIGFSVVGVVLVFLIITTAVLSVVFK